MAEFRFNLSGLASLVRFGKGGKQIKSTNNGLEVRTSDDSAIDVLRVADPVNPEDTVPLGFADNRYANKVDPVTGEKLLRTDPTGLIEETPINVDASGNISNVQNLSITGNLEVQGSQSIIESQTVRVADKNIELADGSTTDTQADGGGLDLIGATVKFLRWLNSRDAWVSSEHLDLEPGKEFRVGGQELFSTKTSDDLQEGVTNLYFTPVNIANWLNTITTDDIAEGIINLYFTDATANTWLATRTTDNLAEGLNNKYFNQFNVSAVFLVVNEIGHGFNEDQVLARDTSTGSIVLADSINSNRFRPIGIVHTVPNADTYILCISGIINRTPGHYPFSGIAYLDPLIPGAITETEPITGNTVMLGYIDNNGLFNFRPEVFLGTASDFITEFEAGLLP